MSSDATPATDRIVALDILKAVAICLMVMGHVVQGLEASQIAPREGWMHEFNAIVYRFHMHAFFFASGAVMALRPLPPFRSLLTRRLGALYYPHVLWGAIYYAIAVLFVRFYNSPIDDPGNVPRHVFEILIGQKSWFLPTLLAVTLLAWPLLRRARPLALLIALALALWPLQSGLQVADYFVRFAIFFVAGYLAIGIVLRITDRLPAIVLGATGAALLGVLVLTGAAGGSGIAIRLHDLVFGMVGVIALWALCSALGRAGTIANTLAWLGNASLAIFLLHPLATGATRALLLRALPQAEPWLYLLVISLAGIALPALAYALAPRLKMQWLFAWPTRRHRA